MNCGICSQPAVWFAAVPMCGERPYYPLCEECLDAIVAYAEDIDLIGPPCGHPECGLGVIRPGMMQCIYRGA